MGEALEPGRRPDVVARRDHLHRRDLQGRGEAHLRQRRVAGRPDRALQLEPRGQHRRAIDIHEGEKLDARAFKALVRAAVDFNTAGAEARSETNSRRSGSAQLIG